MKKLIIALTVPVLFAACTTTTSEQTIVTPTQLQHHNWELSQVDGKAVSMGARGVIPNIEIGESLFANGSAGCNSYRGQAEIDPKTGQFRISKMATTLKMCSPQTMTVENIVTSTLSAWSNIELTKETLTLSNDEHTLTYTLRDFVN